MLSIDYFSKAIRIGCGFHNHIPAIAAIAAIRAPARDIFFSPEA
jgi:hypothetical protein